MQRRIFSVVLATGVLFSFSVPSATAETSARMLPCNTSQTVQLGQLSLLEDPACDYKNANIDIDGSGRSFAVPPAGLSVAMNELRVDGTGSSGDVVVFRSEAGEMAVKTSIGLYGSEKSRASFKAAEISIQKTLAEKSSPAGPTSNKATTPAPILYAGSNGCNNSAYQYAGWKWVTPFDWQYNAAGQPSADALGIMQNAGKRWTGSISACNQNSSSSASQRFQYGTSTRPQVREDGTCGSYDTENIIGWGVFNDSRTLALTCTWYRTSDGRAFASDQNYNVNKPWFTSGTCNARFDLESVAVHEWGHTYGLTHVDQNTGQVMVPEFNYCQPEYRSLGRGDALGITGLYPN
ncbi:matrixin family metalloprotease [Arthrobacter russicus]|jgi:hypothetical protein|uniref:Peptidase M10 metallopeptidase domain-containing protein n=1 Tax=Arthrobacter russicus TaxID=172040 RepID=A0ABU1JEQ6_9MICC|nr:matrixin family metalloprotease [Arthrobacter russicus]MDR6270870.1 hypothetical protein [Arthrobacter russicus]